MVKELTLSTRITVKMILLLDHLLHSHSLFLPREDLLCDPVPLYQELLLNMDKIVLLVLLSKIPSILMVEQSINQLLPTI